MTEIRRYDPRLYRLDLEFMLVQHSMDRSLIHTTPELGLVAVGTAGFAFAAAFLRKVEGGLAILDGLITDPCIPAPVRDQALDLLVENLLILGKSEGIRSVIAWSKDKNTLERSLKHGFVHSNHTLIFNKLG